MGNIQDFSLVACPATDDEEGATVIEESDVQQEMPMRWIVTSEIVVEAFFPDVVATGLFGRLEILR